MYSEDEIKSYMEGKTTKTEQSTIRPRSIEVNFSTLVDAGLDRVGQFELENVNVNEGSIVSELQTVYSPESTVGPRFEAQLNKQGDSFRYIIRGQMVEGQETDGSTVVYVHAKLLVGEDRLETVSQVTEKYNPDLDLILSSVGTQFAKDLNR